MRLRRSPAVHPDAISGLVDAVLTLAVTLCNAGLLSREALAAAFDETAAQQQQQCSQARKAPVAALRQFFSMPVVGDRRFRIVAGGRPDGGDE